MNIRYGWPVMAIGCLMIVGCGKSNDAATVPPPPPKPQGTVFDGLISQKERARKGVEDAMEKNKEKLDEAMKQSEPNSSADEH